MGCCGGCYGCCGGGYGCGGGCYGCGGGYGAGIATGGGYGAGIGGDIAWTTTTPAQTQQFSEAEAPATIIVNVPAAAKVTIDGVATTSTSSRRVFVSPELSSDKEFHYTLQAEFEQDGKPVSVKKVVAVRGGRQTEVNLFATEATGVASR
jgi:uncharacterized protein (TIGR03000 family)